MKPSVPGQQGDSALQLRVSSPAKLLRVERDCFLRYDAGPLEVTPRWSPSYVGDGDLKRAAGNFEVVREADRSRAPFTNDAGQSGVLEHRGEKLRG